MKGRKTMTLLLIAATFAVLMELENQVQQRARDFYEEVIAKHLPSPDPSAIPNANDLLSLLDQEK